MAHGGDVAEPREATWMPTWALMWRDGNWADR